MSHNGKTLYITNGGATKSQMEHGGISDDILTWDDVLHEGPVPAGLDLEKLSEQRAAYIAECAWADLADTRQRFRERDTKLAQSLDYQSVILLFEHDLYDQLQLVQLLDWFANQKMRSGFLFLAQADDYLGTMQPPQIVRVIEHARPVLAAQLGVARNAWRAYRSSNPRDLEKLLRTKIDALPFLGDALLRQLEQYPYAGNGLNRTEQQILMVVDAGKERPGEIFEAFQAMEEAHFMGDSTFWIYMNNMMTGDTPLLQTDHGGPLHLPASHPWPPEFGEQRVTTTDHAKDVVENRADWLSLKPIDKWYGGVHLTPDHRWRWDDHDGQLVKG